MEQSIHNSNVTYREILRQQNGWRAAIDVMLASKKDLFDLHQQFSGYTWVFAGCGTSYYLAQAASFVFTYITGTPSRAVAASEILIYPGQLFGPGKKTILIPISRSGTTSEIVKAGQLLKEKFKVPSVAISCNQKSQLALQSDYQLKFPFESEKSVVMTGSFTIMLLAVTLFSAVAAAQEDLLHQIKALPEKSSNSLKKNEQAIRDIAADTVNAGFVFLGQGPYFGLANEASLKLQEMSISQTQSFHSLEYRHGPMSTVTADTVITILASGQGLVYEVPLVADMKKLGAKVFVIAPQEFLTDFKAADFLLAGSDGSNGILSPLMYMPLLQLLAYYRAIAKDINPDVPQNLSQVVRLNI